MSVQTVTPIDVKQKIHQVIEQLPEEQLPKLLHLSKTLLNGKSANPSPQTEHPWMKFAGMFGDDADWEEFLECLAEVRREDNQIEDYDAVE